MTAVRDVVEVELNARMSKYEADVKRARATFDSNMSAIEKSAARTEGLITRAMGGMGAALAGVSAVALARTFLDIADRAKSLDAQLRLATKTFGSFGQAQKDVDRIATGTRSGLEETASLYAVFLRNARELNLTQEQAARATQTVAETYKISGASAAEAAQGQVQLVQALQSGTLRGDEFNSMMENSPRLAKLLADSLGVTTGQLRKMAEAGELTSAKLTAALTDKKFTAGIDEEFRQLPVTFDQAMTQVENTAIKVFGAFDRGGQFSTAIATFITDGASGFADLERAAESFGRKMASELAGSIAIAQNFVAELKNIAAQLGINDKLQREGLRGGGSVVAGVLDPLGTIIRNSPAARKAAEQRNRELALAKVMGGDPLADYKRPEQKFATAAAAGKKTTGGRKRTPKAPVDYTEQELSRLNEEELRARLDLATDVGERADIAKQLLGIERDDLTRRLKARKALTPEAQKVIDTIYGAPGTDGPDGIKVEGRPGLRAQQIMRDAEEQRARQASELVGLQQDALSAEGQLLEGRKEQFASQLRILDLMEKEERARLESQITNGQIAAADAESARIALGRAQTARREGAGRDAEGPLARYRRDLNNPDRRNDEVESAVIGELEGVRDSISSAVQKTLGIKNPILAALINSFIEQQLIKPLLDGFGGSGGGGFFGSVIGGIGSLFGFGGARAAGGPVSAGKSYLVGERGPERIVMGGNGVVVPNHALGGRGGGTTVISAPQFDLRGAVMTRELYADMERISAAYADRAGQAAVAQAVRLTPVLQAKRSRYG